MTALEFLLSKKLKIEKEIHNKLVDIVKNHKLSYPLLPDKFDKRKKIKINDKQKLLSLYKEIGLKRTAEFFNVTPNTIRYHIDKNFRKKTINNAKYRIKRLWKLDETFRKKHRANREKSRKYTKAVGSS